MGRWLALVLLLVLHGNSNADDCQEVTDRSRPILIERASASGRTFTDADAAQQVVRCRRDSHRDPIMGSVLAATGATAVRACWKPALEHDLPIPLARLEDSTIDEVRWLPVGRPAR